MIPNHDIQPMMNLAYDEPTNLIRQRANVGWQFPCFSILSEENHKDIM